MRVREFGQQVEDLLGVFLHCGLHALRPADSVVFFLAAARDEHGHAAEVLDQAQAQRDREGPQLADLQRFHALIGRNERCGVFLVEQPVEVCDQLERHVVYARESLAGPGREARKLAAVAFRQVDAGELYLLFDHVEIIKQPFRGGRHAPSLPVCPHKHLMGGAQRLRVVRQAREQPVIAGAVFDRVGARQFLCEAFQLLHAEQLGAQRLLGDIRHVAEPARVLLGGPFRQ